MYDFERKTNGSTAALMSGKKKKFIEKNYVFGKFGIFGDFTKIFWKKPILSGFFQKLFEKSQFNPAGLIRLFSSG